MSKVASDLPIFSGGGLINAELHKIALSSSMDNARWQSSSGMALGLETSPRFTESVKH